VQASAQTAEPKPISANGDNNEDSKAALDFLAQNAGKDKLIILIARLGDKESSLRLNKRRLRTIRLYLENTRGVTTQRIITATGDHVSGRGRVEAYLDGKLFMVFTLSHNLNFAPES